MSSNTIAQASKVVGPPIDDTEAEHDTDLLHFDTIAILFSQLSEPCQCAICANVEALAALAAA